MLRELSLKAQRRRKEQAAANASAPAQTTSNQPNAPVTTAAQNASSQTTSPPKQSRMQSIPRRLSRGASSFHRASSLLAGRPPRANTRSSGPIQQDRIPRPSQPERATTDVKTDQKRTFPKRTGVTYPLVTVDELFRWRPTGLAAKCVSKVPLSEAAIKRYTRGQSASGQPAVSSVPHPAGRGAAGSLKRLQPPRLLVCHDFRGGYQEWEASATGVKGEECPPDTEMWRFNHWAYVDIFVYFSHHCVTIPPVGYIQAGHRHGSLVLGTLIFEWDEGLVELQKILANFKTRAKAAAQLAAIAKFYGFDGWLVNVEVALPTGSVAASDLAAFVGDLTRSMRKIVGPVSEVIWYDSVTRDGSLAWQNELNAENEQFFKAAGSIFTNYHWDRNAPIRSAAKAGTRRTDVFTGVDIHGRNTFGGGGFHTHLALRAIKQGGTSAAIFAPAWTVDKCPPNSDPRELEERFWTGPRGKFGREAVSQFFKERAVITELPFSTSFNPGWGPRFMRNGAVKDSRRYFNMAEQQIQPSFMRTSVAAGDTNAANLCLSHEQALNGSASMKTEFAFSDSRMVSGTHSVLRLFVANVSFPTILPSRVAQGSLKIAYSYYAQTAEGSEPASDDFGILLSFGSPPCAVLLVGENSLWNTQNGPGAGPRRINPRIQLLGKFVNFEVIVPTSERQVYGADKPTDGSPGWRTRTFSVDAAKISGQRLSEVMIIVGRPAQHAVSVRPSPLMSAAASRGGSRINSRVGSRLGSRAVSRSNSPPRAAENQFDNQREPGSWSHGLRQLSNGHTESLQPQFGNTEETPAQGDDFGGSLLQQYRESFGQRRRSDHSSQLAARQHDGRHQLSQGVDQMNRSTVTPFARRLGSDPPSVFSAGNSSIIRPRIGERREYGESGPLRPLSSRLPPNPTSYSSNFEVDGSIDFAHMEQEESGMHSTATSRATSRLASRLATPSGSRPLSRIGSIAPSATNSRATSVIHSRRNSRVTSPSATPLGSSSMGALPIGSSFSRDLSNRFLSGSAGRLQLESGMATPSRGAAPLSDLKSALMQAAGSMAGEAVVVPGTDSASVNIVYLGSVSLELENVEQVPSTRLRNVREM